MFPLPAPRYLPIQLDKQWLAQVYYNEAPSIAIEYYPEELADYYIFRFAFDIAQERAEWVQIQGHKPEYYSGDSYIENLDSMVWEYLSDDIHHDVSHLSADEFQHLQYSITDWFYHKIMQLSVYLENVLFPPGIGLQHYLSQLDDYIGPLHSTQHGYEGPTRWTVHEYDRKSGLLILTMM